LGGVDKWIKDYGEDAEIKGEVKEFFDGLLPFD
jgi:hypothetical protein